MRLLPELEASCDPAAVRCPAAAGLGQPRPARAGRGAQRLADALPDGELVVLAGVGHCPQVERPRQVADLLDRRWRGAACAAGRDRAADRVPVLIGAGQLRANRERDVEAGRASRSTLLPEARAATPLRRPELAADARCCRGSTTSPPCAPRAGPTTVSPPSSPSSSAPVPADLHRRAHGRAVAGPAARRGRGPDRGGREHPRAGRRRRGAGAVSALRQGRHRPGQDLGWSTAPGGPPRFDPADLGTERMHAAGLVLPARIYPLFENRLQADLGLTPEREPALESAELYAAFSRDRRRAARRLVARAADRRRDRHGRPAQPHDQRAVSARDERDAARRPGRGGAAHLAGQGAAARHPDEADGARAGRRRLRRHRRPARPRRLRSLGRARRGARRGRLDAAGVASARARPDGRLQLLPGRTQARRAVRRSPARRPTRRHPAHRHRRALRVRRTAEQLLAARRWRRWRSGCGSEPRRRRSGWCTPTAAT